VSSEGSAFAKRINFRQQLASRSVIRAVCK
jgi:hypothetical protein